ncbi:MAG TPA: hypothetical protein VMA98_00275 [Candidatus Acidoferrales bacterium]|nr:hypothetical protein [Candidatus Acidoferrales bacterium]
MFFIIWRGWGFLAVLIPLVLVFVCAVIGAMISPIASAVGVAVGGAIGAYLVWTLGVKWNSAPGRVLVDPSDGSQVVLRRTHSLFWIPMQWWGPVMGVLALLLALSMAFAGNPGAHGSTT